MKILVFSEFNKYGGTREYTERLLKYLNSQGFEVLLASEYFDKDINSLLKKYKFDKWILRNTNNNLRKIIEKLLPIFSWLWLSKRIIQKYNPDLVLVTVGTPAKYLGSVCSGKRTIYVLHTSPNFPLFTKRTKILEKIVMKRLFRNTTFVAVSKYCEKKIKKEWHIESSKVSTIYHYFELFNKNILKPKQGIVLSIGQLEWYKNPKLFIEVATKVNNVMKRNVQFVWLGDGTQYKEMLSMSKEMKYVQFAGYKKNVNNWYKNTLIYFQPSIEESFGLAVGGAMRRGIPCVVSKVGGLPELVGKSFNLNNTKEMVNEICDLIRKDEYWKKCSSEMLARIRSKYTYLTWKNKMDYLIGQYNDK